MWHDIQGHDQIVELFRRTIRAGRLATTYLFVGPAGIGKRTFALRLAQSLLCLERTDDQLDFCGNCESCRLATAQNHPDLLTLGLPEGKNILPIELFVGDREHRHQAGLCHHLSLRPFLSGRRVAVIDDADHFNQESANCLLKTLEEPPPHSLLILIGTSPSRQLPTIRSRAQMVRFRPLDADIVAGLLVENNNAVDPAEATSLAALSDGSLQRAYELADTELTKFRDSLLAMLSDSNLDAARTTRAILEFVDGAGKDAGRRRARLRTAIEIAIGHCRQRMIEQQTIPPVDQLEHCLSALEYLDRNVNQASLVNWWIAGMANKFGSTTARS